MTNYKPCRDDEMPQRDRIYVFASSECFCGLAAITESLPELRLAM